MTYILKPKALGGIFPFTMSYEAVRDVAERGEIGEPAREVAVVGGGDQIGPVERVGSGHDL